MFLFLSVYSNKIRKRREDGFKELSVSYIFKGNEELYHMYLDSVHSRGKNWYDIFKKQPKFYDAILAVSLFYEFRDDEVSKFKYKYTSDFWYSFDYQCGSSETYSSNLRHIDFDYYQYVTVNLLEIRYAIAQYEAFRFCIKRKYDCENFDPKCMIKKIAFLNNLDINIYEPGNHEFTYENINKDKKVHIDLRDEEVIEFKEPIKYAILYSSQKYLTTKFKGGRFNFENLLYKSKQPYLILLKATKDNINYAKDFTKDIDRCSICFDIFNENSKSLIVKCGHKFHRECFDDFINSRTSDRCPYCRTKLELQEYIDDEKSEEEKREEIKKYIQSFAENDPVTIFYKQYKEFIEKNPNQIAIINEKKLIDRLKKGLKDSYSIRKDYIPNLMHLISKVYYLDDPEKKINNIEILP